MPYLHKNLTYLKEKNPSLYRAVCGEKPLVDLKIAKIETRNVIIEYEGIRCFLHSMYSVEDELNTMFKDVDKDCNTLVVFGLGMGYILEYINQHFKEINHLIIIEPSLQIFNESLNHFCLRKGFENIPNLTIIVNKSVEYSLSFLKTLLRETTNFPLVFHFNYKYIFSDYYKSTVDQLIKAIRNHQVSTTTIGVSNYHWLENSIVNFLHPSNPVEEICSLLNTKPSIIVSAGPSLNKNVHKIEELKEFANVIAVGSAIKILDSHGIEPHFRMAIDGLPREEKILDGIETKGIPIIYGSKLYKTILPNYYYDEKLRLIEDTDYIGKYLYKNSHIEYLKVNIGPSVANVALSLLIKAGCKCVIFMGQDLCYTLEKSHAEGTNKIKENILNEKNFKNYNLLKDINNNDVYTHNNLITVKYSMEQQISSNSNISFINATEGGLEIKGAINKTAQQTLEFLKNKSHFLDGKSNQIMSFITKKDDNYEEKLERGLQLFERELKEVFLINYNQLSYLKKIKKNINRKLNYRRLENDINYLNQYDKQRLNISVFSEVIAPSLSKVFEAIYTTHHYKGKDKYKKLEAEWTYLFKVALEIEKYIVFALQVLKNVQVEKNQRLSK
ncbi:6-hydroxymethylpterin diphosphokinase MptE-like protein [Priestia megaterium]